MDTHYTTERNVQIVIALMKAHGVRRVIASPGTTNITLVASMQQDDFFEIYSSVDERSAAYMACGMAAETGEPVAISCTGATASRNYVPGLTEAYYRQLPVLAITSTQHTGRVGQLAPQVLDRSQQMRDIARLSVQVPTCHCAEDERTANRLVNEAILELTHDGAGPVHINLQTEYSKDFSCVELPRERVIRRYGPSDELPAVPRGRVGIYVGGHGPFSSLLTEAVDAFCEAYGAVVLCDHTSNYRGRFRCVSAIALSQDNSRPPFKDLSLLVHIGEVSGAYVNPAAQEVWRVAPDGRVRDTFGTLTAVFEMGEVEFFRRAVDAADGLGRPATADEWNFACISIRERIPELPLSNLWVAQRTAPELPVGCCLHLGILNSLRSWNMFEVPEGVEGFSNTGGFGIDGGLSAAVGASLASPRRIFICALGDLAFFYDMNALGNRHVGPNLRVLLVNNGEGAEFRNYNHFAARFGEDADLYMAAAGHYGARSRDLVRHYAEDLGFEYVGVETKEQYLAEALPRLTAPEVGERPLVVEVFTDDADESEALRLVRCVERDATGVAKNAVRDLLGERGVSVVKKILGR